MAFDKKSYDINYKKNNQKRIYIDVSKEIGEQFDDELKKQKLTRADIILPAIKKFLKIK